MKRALLVLGALAGLTGCDTRPATAEWQNVCVATHDELLYFQSVPVSCGQNCTTIMMQPVFDTVCDQYQVQCIGGKDGTTTCKGTPDA